MADIRLRGRNSYRQTVRMDSDEVVFNPSDPIDAACIGKVIQDVNDGNFENISNLAVVGGTFKAKNNNRGPVQVGTETVTVLGDPSDQSEHELTDSSMVQTYVDSGMRIIRTYTRKIMSG